MPAKKPQVNRQIKIIVPPPGAHFGEMPARTVGSGGIYLQALLQASKLDKVIAVESTDKYQMAQLREKAKKAKLALTFAVIGDTIYVKPTNNGAEVKRLMLLLRDKRSIVYLEAQKLQLDLKSTLADLSEKRLAHMIRDSWVLTEKGMDSVIDPSHLAATA